MEMVSSALAMVAVNVVLVAEDFWKILEGVGWKDSVPNLYEAKNIAQGMLSVLLCLVSGGGGGGNLDSGGGVNIDGGGEQDV